LLTGRRGGVIRAPLFIEIQGLLMPNIASAKKRVRTAAKRTAINTARKTRVRGYIRKVEEAIGKTVKVGKTLESFKDSSSDRGPVQYPGLFYLSVC
jgi:hypothetical protein